MKKLTDWIEWLKDDYLISRDGSDLRVKDMNKLQVVFSWVEYVYWWVFSISRELYRRSIADRICKKRGHNFIEYKAEDLKYQKDFKQCKRCGYRIPSLF